MLLSLVFDMFSIPSRDKMRWWFYLRLCRLRIETAFHEMVDRVRNRSNTIVNHFSFPWEGKSDKQLILGNIIYYRTILWEINSGRQPNLL